MSKELPKVVYLAQLDALLDTRLPIVNKLAGDNVIRILKNGYHYRNVDAFEGISFRDFRQEYAKRDKTILKDSFATPIVKMVQEFIRGVIFNVITTPHHFDPVVQINVYPYKLTDNECKVIGDMMASLIGHKAPVVVVDIPYEDLGPDYMEKNNVAFYAIYDYVDYLNTHLKVDAFNKKHCQDVSLVCPRIIFSDPINQLSPNLDNDFKMTEELMGAFIALNYLPVKDFSIKIPDKAIESMKELT